MKGPYLILLWVPRAWTKALENKRKRFKEGAKVSSVRSECVKEDVKSENIDNFSRSLQ